MAEGAPDPMMFVETRKQELEEMGAKSVLMLQRWLEG